MGLRDRWRQFKDEWDATPTPQPRRREEPKDPGVCCQHGCGEPATGPARLCASHAAVIFGPGASNPN